MSAHRGADRPALVVGLTGGIASGKSAVEALFERHGGTVIDADRVAREVVAPGQAGLRQVVEAFGDDVLKADGGLDRAALRQRVFNHPASRKQLEGIIHPLVRAGLLARLKTVRTPYAILSIPLLLESGQRSLVDRILVVDLPEAEQIARLRRRDGGTEAQAQAILNAQSDRETRRQAADDLIDNSGDRDLLGPQVHRLHHHYLALANAAPHP